MRCPTPGPRLVTRPVMPGPALTSILAAALPLLACGTGAACPSCGGRPERRRPPRSRYGRALSDSQLGSIRWRTVGLTRFPGRKGIGRQHRFQRGHERSGVLALSGPDHSGVSGPRRRGEKGPGALHDRKPRFHRRRIEPHLGGGDFRSDHQRLERAPRHSMRPKASTRTTMRPPSPIGQSARRCLARGSACRRDFRQDRGARSITSSRARKVETRTRRQEPDHGPHHGAQRGARAARAARQCTGSLFGRGPLDHVDAGERARVGELRISSADSS